MHPSNNHNHHHKKMTTMENETTPHGNNHAASFSTTATTMMHSAAVEKVGCCTAAPGFGGCGGRVHAKASTSFSSSSTGSSSGCGMTGTCDTTRNSGVTGGRTASCSLGEATAPDVVLAKLYSCADSVDNILLSNATNNSATTKLLLANTATITGGGNPSTAVSLEGLPHQHHHPHLQHHLHQMATHGGGSGGQMMLATPANCSSSYPRLPSGCPPGTRGSTGQILPGTSASSQTTTQSSPSLAESSSSVATTGGGCTCSSGSFEHLNIGVNPENLETANKAENLEKMAKKAAKAEKSAEKAAVKGRKESAKASGSSKKQASGGDDHAGTLPSMFECTQKIICNPLRQIVSQNRRRYQLDGFNLDLTYITDRIIAMGYPADTREALYRNSMSHIVKFLEHYHPGHYKVFNLRGQYVYDTSRFHNRVISFEMTDHHPPRLELMAPFCREVHDYLQADPQNVVAVHCKAGKGRTGVMICAYLYYILFYATPQQNMDYYSIIRTHNNKGVTIPSQRRYVYYFSHLRRRQLNYMPLLCELVGVYIERPPKLGGTFSKGALKVRVASGDVDVFLGDELRLDSDKCQREEEMHAQWPVMAGDDHYDPYQPREGHDCISRRCYGWTVPKSRRVFFQGDIRVDLFQTSRIKLVNVKQEKKKIGHIWFNTMFTCPGFSGGQYVHGDDVYAPTSSTAANGNDGSVGSADEQQHNNSVGRAPPPSIIQKRLVPRGSGRGVTVNSNSANTVFSFSSSSKTTENYHSPHRHQHQGGSDAGSDTSHGVHETSSTTTEKRRSSSHRFVSTTATTSGGGFRHLGQQQHRACDKKRSGKSPIRQLIDEARQKEGVRGWQSQDAAAGDFNSSSTSKCSSSSCCGRASLDGSGNTTTTTASATATEPNGDSCFFDEEIVVTTPPGLEAHCPEQSLKSIFVDKQTPPRYVNAQLIRDAYRKNLIGDLASSNSSHNNNNGGGSSLRPSRASSLADSGHHQPAGQGQGVGAGGGGVCPKSPLGRPNADGPWCLVRGPHEHVSVFRAREVDRAHKNKDLDPEFKVFIVTKCINEANTADVKLAHAFALATEQKQTSKEQSKKEKLEARQRKLLGHGGGGHSGGGHSQAGQTVSGGSAHSCCSQQHQQEQSETYSMGIADENFPLEEGGGGDFPLKHEYITDSSPQMTTAAASASSNCYLSSSGTAASNVCPQHQNQSSHSAYLTVSTGPPTPTSISSSAGAGGDPRASDPRLRKFFFRQRVTSQSRHPNIHYHCPVQPPDPAVCAKYACSSAHTSTTGSNVATLISTVNDTNVVYADDEAEPDGISSRSEEDADGLILFKPCCFASTATTETLEERGAPQGTPPSFLLTSSSGPNNRVSAIPEDSSSTTAGGGGGLPHSRMGSSSTSSSWTSSSSQSLPDRSVTLTSRNVHELFSISTVAAASGKNEDEEEEDETPAEGGGQGHGGRDGGDQDAHGDHQDHLQQAAAVSMTRHSHYHHNKPLPHTQHHRHHQQQQPPAHHLAPAAATTTNTPQGDDAAASKNHDPLLDHLLELPGSEGGSCWEDKKEAAATALSSTSAAASSSSSSSTTSAVDSSSSGGSSSSAAASSRPKQDQQ